MVVVGRLDQKMPGPIFCPSPALPGSQLGPLPYIFLLLLLAAECTKVIISEFAIQ